MNALPAGSAVTLHKLKSVDADRCVAEIKISDRILIGSIWIVDCRSDPTVSWPKTARGYRIVELDERLKAEAERIILKAFYADRGKPDG